MPIYLERDPNNQATFLDPSEARKREQEAADTGRKTPIQVIHAQLGELEPLIRQHHKFRTGGFGERVIDITKKEIASTIRHLGASYVIASSSKQSIELTEKALNKHDLSITEQAAHKALDPRETQTIYLNPDLADTQESPRVEFNTFDEISTQEALELSNADLKTFETGIAQHDADVLSDLRQLVASMGAGD